MTVPQLIRKFGVAKPPHWQLEEAVPGLFLFCFGVLAGGVHPGTINAQFVFHLRHNSGGSENTFIYIGSFGGNKCQLP